MLPAESIPSFLPWGSSVRALGSWTGQGRGDRRGSEFDERTALARLRRIAPLASGP